MSFNCANGVCMYLQSVYSCKKYSANNHTSPLEKTVFVFLCALFLLSVLWLYCWSILHNDTENVNTFLFEQLYLWFNWYLLVMCVSVVSIAYLLIVVASALIKLYLGYDLHLHVCHKVMIIIMFIIVVAGFSVVGMFYSESWLLINVSFEIIGPFLQVSALVLWVVLGWYLAHLWHKVAYHSIQMLCGAVYCASFIFLCSIPLWLYSSCITETDSSLPEKPVLFAHRGASTVRPENTILAFQKALEYEVYGLETDVRISADGIPFLMHDSNLLRTTDIASKFPSRKNNRAETFTWEELQQLNAGEWFLSTNPFLMNHHLTKTERQDIAQQKIPSLFNYTNLAAKHNKSIIFDLFRPPNEHGFYYSYVNVSIQTILNTAIKQEDVVWLHSGYQNIVQTLAPGFRIASSSFVQNASMYGIEIFNLLHTDVTKSVTALGYPVIAYTVNDDWAYSRMWCQGAWAVTTEFVSKLDNLHQPLWFLSTGQFLGIWIALDVFFLLVLAVLILWYIKKRKKASTEHFNHQSDIMIGSSTLTTEEYSKLDFYL